LLSLPSTISYDAIKTEQEQKFKEALESTDYKRILAVFNRKELVKSVGHFFGIVNQDYCDYIIRQLHSNNAKTIINAIKPYLPPEIPICRGL